MELRRFFFQEFIPMLKIIQNKKNKDTSHLWLSMGGELVLYALRRPDLFSSAAPLSASLGPQSVEQMNDHSYQIYWGYSKSNFNKSDFEKFKKKIIRFI